MYMYMYICNVHVCTVLYMPHLRYDDTVDPAQFDVDLEAQVGQSLWRWLADVLGLHTLCRHSKQSVSYPFDLSCVQGLVDRERSNIHAQYI